MDLAFIYPALLPSLQLIPIGYPIPNEIEEYLNNHLIEHLHYGRSDAVTWCLYFLHKNGLKLASGCRNKIIESKDCLSISMLYLFDKNSVKAKAFAEEIVNCGTQLDLDQYWLLLYEAYRRGQIKNPYDDDTFVIMKANKVKFLQQS